MVQVSALFHCQTFTVEEVPAAVGGHDGYEEAKVVRVLRETQVLSGLRKVIRGVEGGKEDISIYLGDSFAQVDRFVWQIL